MQPRTYVIAHPASRVIDDCVASLMLHGWPHEIWPAVDGRSITAKDWRRIGVTMSPTAGKLPRRPGAQGCWFSHFGLWERCAATQDAMIILEHDALVQAEWPQDLDMTKGIVKLYRQAACKTKPGLGTWSKGSHAYAITPEQAHSLLDRARTWGASPVDKHMISGDISWRFFDRDLVLLSPGRGASTTSHL